MKVAIIGAGINGLISAKYCLEEGYECDVFEQSEQLGGAWVYTDEIGTDENGFRIHSVMYKGLRTNTPKEIMSVPDVPFPDGLPTYITSEDVLAYMHHYADHYSLGPVIKYFHHVSAVKPTKNQKWEVTVQSPKTEETCSLEYDAVVVCNGHYAETLIPEIPGQDVFRGVQTNSRDYRRPEKFKDKKVLVIGAGSSGQDISALILDVATSVLLSHRKEDLIYLKSEITKNRITQKPLVTNILENAVVFEDGTVEDVDVIIYCTGFKYLYPFLTEDCGIKVSDRFVGPLYKQIINVEYPSMGFIGITYGYTSFVLFDLQVRFFLAALSRHFILPEKEEMIKDFEQDLKVRNCPGNHVHSLRRFGLDYVTDLANTASIKPIPLVLHNLAEFCISNRIVDIKFNIINDTQFTYS